MKMNNNEILKSVKILYVEDDIEAREEMGDVLKRRVGKLLIGGNGKQGLELYDELEPDIILADLYMPEMGGIEMIREIKERGSKAVVVAISAVSEADTFINAIDVGIDKYILKPVNMRELLDTLSNIAVDINRRKKTENIMLPENKKEIEDAVKREFASFLKSVTGKGPRDVSVFMNGTEIELTAFEVMTIMEKNILDNYQNIDIIKRVREIFFSTKEDDICQMISDILQREVMLKEVIINVAKDRNKLKFIIKH